MNRTSYHEKNGKLDLVVNILVISTDILNEQGLQSRGIYSGWGTEERPSRPTSWRR